MVKFCKLVFLQTLGNMIDNVRFQKNEEYIEVKDGKYLVNLEISTTEAKDSILIDLHSLEIHTYASRKDKINQEIHDSVLSFIHQGVKLKGEDEFVNQLKSLGFKQKSIESAIKPTVFAKREATMKAYAPNGSVKKYSEEFELA